MLYSKFVWQTRAIDHSLDHNRVEDKRRTREEVIGRSIVIIYSAKVVDDDLITTTNRKNESRFLGVLTSHIFLINNYRLMYGAEPCLQADRHCESWSPGHVFLVMIPLRIMT